MSLRTAVLKRRQNLFRANSFGIKICMSLRTARVMSDMASEISLVVTILYVFTTNHVYFCISCCMALRTVRAIQDDSLKRWRTNYNSNHVYFCINFCMSLRTARVIQDTVLKG